MDRTHWLGQTAYKDLAEVKPTADKVVVEYRMVNTIAVHTHQIYYKTSYTRRPTLPLPVVVPGPAPE